MSDPMMIIYGIFVFLLTTAIGSFLNVVIYRLPLKMNLAKPASHCPKCNNPIKWYDNIPIISYIALRGKCRYCKEKISPRYLIVEALTGVFSTLIFIRFGVSFNALFGIILFLTLIPIAFIDFEHLLIPDSCIIILLVLGILGLFFNNLSYGEGVININYVSKLISLGIVLVFSFIVILLERLLKRDLMGGGDLKLLGVVGLLLGWQLLLMVIALSSILACIVEIARERIHKQNIKRKEEKEDTVIIEEETNLFAFGPYIAISAIVIYCFGINIIEWWLGLLA